MATQCDTGKSSRRLDDGNATGIIARGGGGGGAACGAGGDGRRGPNIGLAKPGAKTSSPISVRDKPVDPEVALAGTGRFKEANLQHDLLRRCNRHRVDDFA